MTLIGSLFFAKKYNCDLKVMWETTHECNCFISDIFCNSFDIITREELLDNITEKSHIYGFGYSDYQKCYVESLLFINKKHFIDNNRWCINNHTINHSNNTETIIYNDITIPHYITDDDVVFILKNLIIQPVILHTVKEFISKHSINKNTKGILIRKTDLTHNSTLDHDFFIYKQIKDNKQQKYFITSDDANTEQRLSRLENVVTMSCKSYVTYDSETGYLFRNRQSVIDGFKSLLILASTTPVSNSENSSFFAMSKYYSQCIL
jgi:hypothetical protein